MDIDLKRGVDFIGVGCVFFCHDGKGNVLLHKRSDKCRDEHGKWDSGAGAVEHGETFEETIRREVLEEYLAESLDVKYVSTRTLIREHEGKTTHWVQNLHLVLVDPDKVGIGEPEKMEEIGWFPFDDLPEPLHSALADDVWNIKQCIK